MSERNLKGERPKMTWGSQKEMMGTMSDCPVMGIVC